MMRGSDKDQSVYVEYDPDTLYWGVFGDFSGFCYSTGTQEACEHYAKSWNANFIESHYHV